MHVHFIAIGGSAMHNLAIALHQKGYCVTGSDDEIFDPARTRLQRLGLLPAEEGWHPERITSDLDAVVLGMHARKDNPELLRAQELGLKIYSYPEFLYEQSRNKTRIVVGGSHGKTTTTAIILHVLRCLGIDTDYMVGAQLEGFDVMVRLSEEAKTMVFEGDEYLTSPIDPRPKFHLYRPHIAILTGIEWDHINVFPTKEIYSDQFLQFINLIEPGGTLVYCADDPEVCRVVESCTRLDLERIPYTLPPYEQRDGQTVLIHSDANRETPASDTPLKVFGQHNLLNLTAARYVCNRMGISNEQFYSAIGSFAGASNRLQLVRANDSSALYRDFAHAPSKLRATIRAVREKYPERQLVACFELHTYSSLNPAFLSQYAGTTDGVDVPVVYFNPHALQIKHLPDLSVQQVMDAFANPNLKVFSDSAELLAFLNGMDWNGKNLLMMSSGNFNGISLNDITIA